MILFISLIIIFNTFLYLFKNKYAKFLNIYDEPDNVRKIHQSSVPLIGGSFIYFNLIFYFVISYSKLFDQSLINEIRILNLDFFLTCTFFFIVGLIDDKRNLTPNTKLLFSIIILALLMYRNPSSIISSIYIDILDVNYSLGLLSIPFTLLCFLLFINAFNMFDGINMQSSSYAVFIFLLFTINNSSQMLSITLIIVLLFFLYENRKGKIFFGDNGTLMLGFIISYLFISDYNFNSHFSIEEIFLIMSLPGYELLRVTITRIGNKKHPFSPDRQHLHHYLIAKLNTNQSILVLIALSLIPYLSSIFLNMHN